MVTDLFIWWYGAGFRSLLSRMRLILAKTVDMFSVDLLFRTLFAPFRQIDAGGAHGPLGLMAQRFIDKLFSRFVGFLIRSFTIFLGLVVLLLTGLGCLVWIVGWLVAPVAPVLGVVLAVAGAGR